MFSSNLQQLTTLARKPMHCAGYWAEKTSTVGSVFNSINQDPAQTASSYKGFGN